MTPIEWISLANLVIIPIAGLIWKLIRDSVQSESLKSGIDTAVRAAEELAASGKISDKLKYTEEYITSNYPQASQMTYDQLLVMLHASVQRAGLGASAKLPPAL